LSFSLLGVSANDLAGAAVTQAKSLSDLLDGRSPGERTAAQLTKTKHKRSPASALFSRIAPPDRGETAPPAAGGGEDLNEASQLLAGAPPIAVAPPIAEVAFNPPTLAAIIGGSGPGNASAPPSVGGAPPSGGGPASFPASEPHEPLTPVSAVPEPGTWATMLLGFGLLGWRLRRRAAAPAAKRSAA